MRHRSYLFVPGNRPERFAKACNSGTDVVIIDLEDAVPPEEKASARHRVAAWRSAEHPVYIRINGADTDWFEEDLLSLDGPGISGVVLPKAGNANEVAFLADRLAPGVHILPIVETALGVWNTLPLAKAPRVERIAFGALDLQLDTGIGGDGEELLYARSRVVLASRVANILPPLDGVTTAIDVPEQLAADVARARRLGFGGKLCIHPKQVGLVNDGFLPTATEVEWAQRVLEAVEARGEGAVSLDGKMVDRPVIEKARKIMVIVQGLAL